jgi:lipid II:glycine glycyltransferase (peptidoglycan interpeptide bridge formation enzyme)
VTTITASEWDAFVAAHPDGHILQTPAWADLKCAFGWSAARVGVREKGHLVAGAQVLFRSLAFGLLTIAYLPKGPLVDWNNTPLVNFLFESLDTLCRSANALFLKIEPPISNFQLPISNLQSLIINLQASPHTIQPRRTLVVDLRPDEDAILAAMKQKTRYNIRLAAKKGVVVSPSDDVEAFNKLVRLTGERDKFGVHSDSYYRKAYELFQPIGRAQLFLASSNGETLAGLMLFLLGKRAWYFYGGSSEVERNRMPAYLLQWEAMRWAKAHGATEYDLWGVPDEDEATLEANFESRRDGLWGVYRFKRGFGGQLVRAPGAYDRVYSPMMYRLYLAYLKRRGGLEG